MTTLHVTRKLAAAALAILLLAAHTFAGMSPMTPLVSRNGGFSISMPGQPEYTPEPMRGANGRESTMHVWQVMTGAGHLYMVAYSDADGETDPGIAARGFIQGTKGEVTKANDFTFDGHPGRYTIISTPSAQYHHYATIAGGRLYQVVFATNLKNPIPDEASAFVSSFKLL